MATILVALLVATGACAAPIQVSHLDQQAAYRELSENVLSSGDPSEMTRTTLRARGLLDRFEQDPAAALQALHKVVRAGHPRPHDLFALCEASFAHAEQSGNRSHYLAAAIYALAFLFPPDAGSEPGRFDPRTRIATEIYSAALVEVFRAKDGTKIELVRGVYELPFGQLDLTLDPGELSLGARQLTDLVAATEIKIEGLRNRYRHAGLGASLAAWSKPTTEVTGASLLGPNIYVPITAVLMVDDPVRALQRSELRGRVDVYASSDTRAITIGGQSIPLAYEDSVALALTLAAAKPWHIEYAGFFGRRSEEYDLPLLRGIRPHLTGRTPVVFVHGTVSSPTRWADMLNDLWSDPAIYSHFEPWFFVYDTGNPLGYSAERLRAMLSATLERLDPAGRDTCLRNMVVIGHSQGGLLAKMTAVDTGDDLWNAIARKPFDEVDLSPSTRALIRAALFLDPLPFVRRLVFIATPHHGSYQAAGTLADWIAGFIQMPTRLAKVGREVLELQREGVMRARNARGIATSVENMREGNPFLEALAKIPIAPGVDAHSIIPVLGEGPLEELKDGVVAYRSAHIDGLDSELVVQSGHSTQAEPAAIEEVRRILALHARDMADAGLECGFDTPVSEGRSH